MQGTLQAVAQLDARLWLTLIVHELVEIGVLTLVGCLFRPRALGPFASYIEVDPSELDPSRLIRPPPLYLVPVPASLYDAHGDDGAHQQHQGHPQRQQQWPQEKGLKAPTSPRDLHLLSSPLRHRRHGRAAALMGYDAGATHVGGPGG